MYISPKGKALNPCPGAYQTVEIKDFDGLDDESGGRMSVHCPICSRALYPHSQSSTNGLDGVRFYSVLPRHNNPQAQVNA